MAGVMYEKDETAISLAIYGNDLCGLKTAIETGEDLHYTDRKGNTYLHYLCTMNRPFLIHVLIGMGIDLNAVNRHGNTALHVTALMSDCCHVGDLMAAGIDAKIKNKDGKTAADITTKNSFWKTVYEKYEPGIFESIECHDVDRFLYLLKCWSRVDTMRNGQNLRQFAACRKFHDLVFHIDLHKNTLNAIYSILEGNPDKAWTFLSHSKCNVNFLNIACDSKHILQEVIKLADIRLVRMICRSNVKLNIRVRLKNYLKAPLFFAVLTPQVSSDIMWTVLRSGCDFTLRDEMGRHAAVYALDRWKGHVPYDVIVFMMKNGLDVSHRDATGVTLRDVARFYRRKDILTLIDKAYVKFIRTSNIPELERLCLSGYDSMLINFNFRDTFIYASGNETEDVLNFVQWLTTFKSQVERLFHCIRYKTLVDVSKAINVCQRPDLIINTKDKGGRHPLHLATLYWRFDVLKILLEMSDIDVNTQDNCGRTALHYACCLEDEDERTRFCSILTIAGVNQEILDFTGHSAADYVEDIQAQKWLAKERKMCYGMPKQLACVDKYEELCHMMRGKRKTIHHFNDAVKRFKYPVSQLYSILSPLMPSYQDLLFLAMDHGKEDIAIRLVQLGNNLSIVNEEDSVFTSEAWQSEKKTMTAMEKARNFGMNKLVYVMEQRINYEKEKKNKDKTAKGRKSKSEIKCVERIRKLNTKETDMEDVLFEEVEVIEDDDDRWDWKVNEDDE